MQLLIIDVQNTYRKYCADLINKIPEMAKNYGEVIYLFDNVDGQEFYEEVPDEWMENEEFYNQLKVLSKNYAFFRGLMDAGVDEDDSELVRLAKFMRKHKIIDARNIKEDEEVFENYKLQFKNSSLQNINFEDYSFYLPEDLIEQLESNIKNNVFLVGGGRNECLKEVALLLRVLDIKFSILEEYTY